MFFFIEVSMVMAFIVNYGVDFLMEEDTFDYTWQYFFIKK